MQREEIIKEINDLALKALDSGFAQTHSVLMALKSAMHLENENVLVKFTNRYLDLQHIALAKDEGDIDFGITVTLKTKQT